MAASFETVQNIYRVFSKKLTKEDLDEIMKELATIEGNQSFKDTIKKLVLYHNMIQAKLKGNKVIER